MAVIDVNKVCHLRRCYGSVGITPISSVRAGPPYLTSNIRHLPLAFLLVAFAIAVAHRVVTLYHIRSSILMYTKVGQGRLQILH